LTGSEAGGTLLTRRMGTVALAASEHSIDGADMKTALTADERGESRVYDDGR